VGACGLPNPTPGEKQDAGRSSWLPTASFAEAPVGVGGRHLFSKKEGWSKDGSSQCLARASSRGTGSGIGGDECVDGHGREPNAVVGGSTTLRQGYCPPAEVDLSRAQSTSRRQTPTACDGEVTCHWRRGNLVVEAHVHCFGFCPGDVDSAARAWVGAIDKASRAGSEPGRSSVED